MIFCEKESVARVKNTFPIGVGLYCTKFGLKKTQFFGKKSDFFIRLRYSNGCKNGMFWRFLNGLGASPSAENIIWDWVILRKELRIGENRYLGPIGAKLSNLGKKCIFCKKSNFFMSQIFKRVPEQYVWVLFDPFRNLSER